MDFLEFRKMVSLALQLDPSSACSMPCTMDYWIHERVRAIILG